MTKGDMRDKGYSRPGPAKFVKMAVTERPDDPVTIVSHELSLMDGEPEGYNPYDNPPPPPTEAQLEASLRRRRRMEDRNSNQSATKRV